MKVSVTFGLVALALLLSTAARAQTTFTVNTAAEAVDAAPGDGACDTGTTVGTSSEAACTLRAALEEANATATGGTVAIEVDILPPPTGDATGYDAVSDTWTVAPDSALPAVTRAEVTLDGTTQRGNTGAGAACGALVTGTPHTLKVVLDGSAQGAGSLLSVHAAGAVVQGLVLQNAPDDGVHVNGDGDGARVACSYVGTNAAGDAAAGNTDDGIATDNSAVDLVIENNLISGNGDDGIYLKTLADGAAITGNLIGTNASGDAALGNDVGIQLFGSRSNTIGGTAAADRNVISGNRGDGFNSGGTGTSGTTLQGNYVGTDRTGESDLGNGRHGVTLTGGASGYLIGGTSEGAGNVVSGNTGRGIHLQNAYGSTIEGNLIGTNHDGTTALGNGSHGIRILQVSSGHTIGGTAEGAGNVVAHNGGAGIVLDVGALAAGTGNALRRNRLFANTGLGIDFGNDGKTPNDTVAGDEDGDTGPNDLQNFPEIEGAAGSGATLSVTYTVPTATSNAAYPLTVDFYRTDADGTEGETYLGSDTYEESDALAQKTAAFTPAVPVDDGDTIVATATDDGGNTSEFSSAASVSGAALPVELAHFGALAEGRRVALRWTTQSETSNAGFYVEHAAAEAGFAEAGFVAGAGTTAKPQHYRFAVAGLAPGPHRFRLRQVDFDGAVSYSPVVEARVAVSERLSLELAGPNPFRTETGLHIALPKASDVRLAVYDLLGREAAVLLNGPTPAGARVVSFDASDLPAGTYVVRLAAGGTARTETLVVLH